MRIAIKNEKKLEAAATLQITHAQIERKMIYPIASRGDTYIREKEDG